MTAQAHVTLVDVQPIPTIRTDQLFKTVAQEASPIDKFMAHTNAINRIFVGATTADASPSPELCSVVVLGYLSAVETYFRTLLSRLVHIDPVTQDKLGSKQVLFSVAMSRPRESLAEALYEDSFASAKELKSRLAEIGIGPGTLRPLESAMAEYDKICHLRHCCIHRFGYLGTRNAEDLGFGTHGHLVGALFVASGDELSDIADALQQFVKTCNNMIYRFIIDRTIDNQNNDGENKFDWRWGWSYRSDKRRFEPYYKLFALIQTTPSSRNMKDVYHSFRLSNEAKVQGMTRRRSLDGPPPAGGLG